MRNIGTLADRIAYAMKMQGMSQADLSRKSGLSTAMVAQIVTGKTKDPRFETVVAIARALNVPLNYLAGYVDYYILPWGDDDEG